jgi:hypothetical protein
MRIKVSDLKALADTGDEPEPVDIWNGLPAPVSLAELDTDPPKLQEPLIEDVLRLMAKMLIAGASKSRKSWTLIHLAICISAGLSWLGFKTLKKAVLFLNLELDAGECYARFDKVCGALGLLGKPDNLFIQNLRGKLPTIDKLRPGVVEFAQEHGVGALVIDPFYKMGAGADELSSQDIGNFLADLEALAVEAGLSPIMAHHFTKGDSSQKSVIDLASGTGVFARDPDALMGFRELKDSTETEPLMRMEFVLRSFAPVAPIGLRWQFPIWVVDDTLDLELKQPGKGDRGRPKEHTVEDILQVMGNRQLNVNQWRNECMGQKHMKSRTFDALKAKAEKAGLIQSQKIGREKLCKRTDAENTGTISANINPSEQGL